MKKCFCGNEDLEFFSEDYFVCPKCKTLVSKKNFDGGIYNVSSEDNDFYGSNYWKRHMMEISGENSLDGIVDRYYRDRVPYWLHYLLKYTDNSFFTAEIGGGLGQLASAMRALGYSQEVYELSPEICSYIREQLGANSICGDFSESPQKYDLIVACDLIEHIEDVVGFVESIIAHLTDRGVLCIQAPCYNPELDYEDYVNGKARFLGHLKPDEHIHLFSRESIRQLLTDAGFKTIIFEPAVFGDDYDFFLFASAGKLVASDEAAIADKFRYTIAGRALKASYDLLLESRYFQAEAAKRLEVIKILDEAVHGK